MKAKRVKLTIPRKASNSAACGIEFVGQTDMPSADEVLLHMLARIYEEGDEKTHGTVGKVEKQSTAS